MKTYVAIPTVSALNINPHPRLLAWLQRQGLKPDFVDNFMPQWQARNEIVRRFLASNCDVLQMHDCDTVPTWEHVAGRNSLWHDSPQIVAGYYAMYTPIDVMFQWSVGKLRDRNAFKSLYQFAVQIPEDVSSWDVAGFGCIRIPRRIIEKLWERKEFGPHEGIFHPTSNGVTEDVPVCEAVRALGFAITTAKLWRCEHWRTVDISAQLEAQNALVAAAHFDEQAD